MISISVHTSTEPVTIVKDSSGGTNWLEVKVGKQGFAIFGTRKQTDILEKAFAEAFPALPAEPAPTVRELDDEIPF